MFLPISLLAQLYVASNSSEINKDTKIFYAINPTNAFRAKFNSNKTVNFIGWRMKYNIIGLINI